MARCIQTARKSTGDPMRRQQQRAGRSPSPPKQRSTGSLQRGCNNLPQSKTVHLTQQDQTSLKLPSPSLSKLPVVETDGRDTANRADLAASVLGVVAWTLLVASAVYFSSGESYGMFLFFIDQPAPAPTPGPLSAYHRVLHALNMDK